MANPYTLDFNPLASAISDNQQLDLARNRLAMDQKRLGFEEQRVGWEAEAQPIRLQGLRLGNQQAEQGIKTGRLEYEKAVGASFGGVAQSISERLAKNPNDPAALADYTAITNHPDYKEWHAKNKIPTSDPLQWSQALIARVRPFQDPLSRDKMQAEIAKDNAQAGLFTSQATAGRFVPLPEKSRGVLDAKRGIIIGATDEDGIQRKFNESYAEKEAPKLLGESATAYRTANETRSMLHAVSELAPYAATGFQGPIPPEMALTARKIAAQFSLPGAEKIAPTELFHFLTQKGVFDVVSKMKPATDLDLKAAERAAISMKTDPSTIPYAMPVLIRVQERTMAFEKASMDALRSGRPPRTEVIVADIERRLPLINLRGEAGVVDGAATGQRTAKPATDRLPQPGQQPEAPMQAQGWTQEDLASARPGQKTPNGKYIVGRDGQLYPVSGDAGSERNPLEVGLFSGPDAQDGQFVRMNGKLYQKKGTGWGSLVPVERSR